MVNVESRINALIAECSSFEGKEAFYQFLKKYQAKNKWEEEMTSELTDLVYLYLTVVQYPYSDKLIFSEEPSKKMFFDFYNTLFPIEKWKIALEQREDGSYKIYPDEVQPESMKQLYQKELRAISRKYLETENKTIEALCQERLEKLKEFVKTKKQVLELSSFAPYYGAPSYLFERANYITECIYHLLESKMLPLLEVSKVEAYLQLAKQNLVAMQEIMKQEPTKERYCKIEQEYLQIRTIEDQITPFLGPLWDSYLTNPLEYQEGKRFAFLAHFITGELCQPEVMSKVCLTLLTSQLLPPPNGINNPKFGYLYPMEINHLVTMENGDIGSWDMSKLDLINQNFPNDWRYEPTKKEETYVSFDDATISKLILPTTMEQELVKENYQWNGEILNYQRCNCFSELYFINPHQTYRPNAVFYFEEPIYGETNRAMAMQLAELSSLPVIPLSTAKCRAMLGINEANFSSDLLEENQVGTLRI